MKPVPTPWDDRMLVVDSGGAPVSADHVHFSASELAQAAELRLHKRREEWLLSRFAAKRLAMTLDISPDPRLCTVARPTLWIDGNPSTWFVSLSHSETYGAAAIAREPIGIDVQVIRDLDERAAHLFLSPEEEESVRRCTLANALLHFWCAKEAAWKKRSDEFETLRQMPVSLIEEHPDGLLFDESETRVIGELIVAITRPTS